MLRNLRWDRYVWSELTGPTSLGLLLYTFLMLMNAFFLVAEKTLAKNLGWELTMRLFLYEVPKILILTIPMAVLLGVLIGVGRLSADHEWVAIQSAGFGPSKLLRPVLAYGLLASAVSFAIYAVAVPRANYRMRALRAELIFAANLASDLRPGVFYTERHGTVLFVDNIRPGTENRLEGVLVHQSRALGNFDQLALARFGDLYPVPDNSGRLELALRDGVLHAYRSEEPDTYQVSTFDEYFLPIEPPPYLISLTDRPDKSASDMSPTELWEELRAARSDTEAHPVIRASRSRRAELELHQRIALPLASLLFAVLALPLGIIRVRTGKGAGFALSLAVILLYWVVFTVMRDNAARGELPVWLGAWSGNLVIAPWAALAYWRLLRNRGETRSPLSAVRDGLVRLAGRLGRSGPAFQSDDVSDPSPPLADLGGTTSRFIGRLDQYVGQQFLRMFVFALLSAYMIYTIVELKRLLDGVLRNDLPLSMLFQYFAYALPGMINLVLPVACLVGGIVGVTILIRSGELTAVKASGISMRRISAPILLCTAGLCVGLYLVQDRVTPTTNRKAEEIKDQILGRAPVTYGMPAGGRWAFGPEGKRLYHYRLHDPDRRLFQGLSVLTVDRTAPHILEHRFSSIARWDGAEWDLEGQWQRTFPRDGSIGIYEQEQEALAHFDPPENFTRREVTIARRGGVLKEQMSLQQLSKQIRELSGSGYDTTRIEVSYWVKLAQPWTPLVMVLLGLPFAFRIGRRGALYGIGVAILLVIVYWGTFAVFNALGLETILPPLLAAWAPNVLYGLLGVYLMLYIPT